MAIKRYNGTFTAIQNARRWTGSAWTPLSFIRRWNGSAWTDVLSSGGGSGGDVEPVLAQKIFIPAGKATYWNSGTKDNQYPNELIQGSYGGGQSSARRTLILLPDLSPLARIAKIEVYFQRSAQTHGTPSAYLRLNYASHQTAPTTYTGVNLGAASESVTSFGIGEGKWIELSPAVVERIKSAAPTCLTIDAGADYSLSKYIRCVSSATKIRVTYE